MNLFWKLTHHRFRQRLRIVVRNVSVGRRPTNLSTLYALLRHSSNRNKQKRDFALYEVLRLLISYFSLRRETSVQLLGSRRGFPAFSIVINDSRFSLSPSLRFYARPVSHTCTRHCDIRDYLGLMKVCGRYAANRALVGRPLPIETVPFCRSFKKIIPLINLSRYLHCLSSAIIERSASLSLPSISRFFLFFFFFTLASMKPTRGLR